jgi:hypothetical protein
MKRIEVEIPEGKEAKWVNDKLTLVDITPKYGDIRDIIKTFEDAEKATDIYIPQWALEHLTNDIISYMKMTIIVRALNQGWEPKFIKGEYRYFPWYSLCTQDEIDNMDEDDIKNIVLFGGDANDGANAGLAYAYSYYFWSTAAANLGARLALKSEELAVYFGKQFIEIIKDFIFINKDIMEEKGNESD